MHATQDVSGHADQEVSAATQFTWTQVFRTLHVCVCAQFPASTQRQTDAQLICLQLLGLPASSLRSFVLDSDPIPRAMLSIDPTFAFVKQWPAVKSIMQLGRWFTGQQSPAPVTPARFMYNNVGEVYLIKWTVGQGHKVSSIHPWVQAMCHSRSRMCAVSESKRSFAYFA